jgi:nucleoside-diphosphate-sugar epimerase
MTLTRKILITGADGFVGRTVIARLEAAGFELVRVVRTPGDPGAVVVRDLVDFPGWSSLLCGVDAIIHLAARAHVLHENIPDPLAEFRRVNVTMTLQLAEAAANAGVRRFIFLSSIGVNGLRTTGRPFSERDTPRPLEPYAISKWEAEQGLNAIAARSAMQITRIRPPLILGPGVKGNLLRLVRLVDRGIPLPFGAISNRRSYLTVDDLCELLYLCLLRPEGGNDLFLAANDESISTPELMRAIAAGLGRETRLFPVPWALLRTVTGLFGAGAQLERLASSLQVDATLARMTLDWVPQTSLHAAIELMSVGYLRERRGSNAV